MIAIRQVDVVCAECQRSVSGALIFESGELIDSARFMAFDDPGPVCDDCLGGSAHSDTVHAIEKYGITFEKRSAK